MSESADSASLSANRNTRGAAGPALIAVLEATARTQAVYTLLLVVGLLLRDLELL